jgi:hypothetical protein
MPTSLMRMKSSRIPIVAVIALALVLSGCGDETAPVPETPVETPIETPVATPEPESEPEAEGISDELMLRLEESITSDNTAALEQDFAATVLVTIAASEFSENRSPAEAVSDLDYIADFDGWSFPIDDETLAAAKAGTYGHFILGTPFGGTTTNGDFVVFGVEDGQIVSVYMGVLLEYLVG